MTLIVFLKYYFLIGALFALLFFLVGYRVILPAAVGSKIAVRLVWTPAALILWPLLVYRWLAGLRQKPSNTQQT